jgi:hypothetical protein
MPPDFVYDAHAPGPFIPPTPPGSSHAPPPSKGSLGLRLWVWGLSLGGIAAALCTQPCGPCSNWE